jgi:hypothetical protein
VSIRYRVHSGEDFGPINYILPVYLPKLIRISFHLFTPWRGFGDGDRRLVGTKHFNPPIIFILSFVGAT